MSSPIIVGAARIQREPVKGGWLELLTVAMDGGGRQRGVAAADFATRGTSRQLTALGKR
jgi:hypothetical protein